LKNLDIKNTNNSNYVLHLDRLIITYEKDGKIFNNISDTVLKNSFEFIHDRYLVHNYYLKIYKVYYNGIIVGTLRTKNKLKNPYVEFEFNKQVFYSYYKTF
jgi:hypothetical protein